MLPRVKKWQLVMDNLSNRRNEITGVVDEVLFGIGGSQIKYDHMFKHGSGHLFEHKGEESDDSDESESEESSESDDSDDVLAAPGSCWSSSSFHAR